MVEFTLETQRIEAEEFAERYLRHDRRRGGRRRRGLPVRPPAARRPDAARGARLRRAGGAAARGRVVVGRSGTCCTRATSTGPPALLGRPPEVEGVVVEGDARGGTLGFPTANVAAEPDAARASARDLRRASRQVTERRSRSATNPHYGGDELRIEAFLLGFAGDLYGKRLVVELWQRLRDEQVFDSEQALDRPDRPRRRRDRAGRAARLRRRSDRATVELVRTAAPSDRPRRRAAGDEADAAEVVVAGGPAADGEPARLQLGERGLVDARARR